MHKIINKFKHLNPIHILNKTFFIVVLFSGVAQAAQDWSKVEFDKLDGSTLLFKTSYGSPAPSPLKTTLKDLRYEGMLRGRGEEVPGYFVFIGRGCENCSEEKSVYVVRGVGGRVDTMVQPGKIIDPKTRAVLVDARMFVGRCLNRVPSDVVAVFQSERIDRRRYLQNSVFVAQAGEVHLHEQLVERRLPHIREAVRWVKLKKCREIEGRNRIMTAKRINLRPNTKDEDEDDDEPVKENAAGEGTPAAAEVPAPEAEKKQ